MRILFKFKAYKGAPSRAITVCPTTRDKKAGHVSVVVYLRKSCLVASFIQRGGKLRLSTGWQFEDLWRDVLEMYI